VFETMKLSCTQPVLEDGSERLLAELLEHDHVLRWGFSEYPAQDMSWRRKHELQHRVRTLPSSKIRL
jgi:hypothetical protein